MVLSDIALVWFSRDLRLEDNEAFLQGCNQHSQLIPLFIYEKDASVLGRAQKWWLHHSLVALDKALKKLGLNLVLRQGDPLKIIQELVQQHKISSVYWNRNYEPKAIAQTTQLKSWLLHKGLVVKSFNGFLLNEPGSIKNGKGAYFKVFTPFWKHCLQQMHRPPLSVLINKPKQFDIPSDDLEDWNLLPSPNWASRFNDYWQPGEIGAQLKLKEFIDTNLRGYKINRDIPERDATSKLSPHLHFGEISPWAVFQAVEIAKLDKECDLSSAERFISELGWREFSYHLLYHVPELPSENFRKEFDAFPWQIDEHFLKSWQQGKTGYPLVDAGMRELWATGYMHNRVRMIVASFLTKDLLLDWRLGASWFLDTLVDADLANNSASWQWVAGSGADAAPYFRVFNPILQSEKFDPQGLYIRLWVPELSKVSNKYIHSPWQGSDSELGLTLGKDYPHPLVNHADARNRALEHYKSLRKDS